MAKLLLKGLFASAALSSAEYTSELLAEDNECAAGAASGEHCSLSALQQRARTRLGAAEADEAPADVWAQCGGAKWKGTTTCEDGAECRKIDKYYFQCQPSGSAIVTPAATTTEEAQETPAVAAGPAMKLPENPPAPPPTILDSVNPIVARGNFLYDSVTGKRFFAKGVAYNPRNEKYDHSFGPSVVVKGWQDTCVPGSAKTLSYTADTQADDREEEFDADLEAIAAMGANTVRLYNVDPAKSHKKFMDKAASLGVYVIVPLNGKDWGFLPAFAAPDCYTQEIEGYGNVGVNALSFAKQVVKEFSQYDNTLLFTVANELPQNDKNGFAAFPCVKALTRDIHRYQANCSESMRKVPLIYSDVDMGGASRSEIAEYLTCALESEDDAVDAYGLNVYSWCNEVYPGDGKADNFQYSPYSDIRKDFQDFSVPFLFTEFGCNLGDFKTKCPYKDGRTWPDVKHFVGKDMGEFMSGAIAFQWSMDKEEYGLTLSPGFVAGQDKLYLLDNYYNLQKVYKKYNVSSKWDASPSKVDSCSFLPSDVAPQSHTHKRPSCPGKAIWKQIQTRHGVEKVSDWSVLPPPADSPLSAVDNQTECPAAPLPAAVKASNC